jgi:hypothetical protein
MTPLFRPARLPVLALSAGLGLLAVPPAIGQGPLLPTQVSQTKFDSGQDVVPVYEGWIRNPDGTFDLVFGYFNRNYKEELAIPVGPANTIDPPSLDGGQPTYFLPRRQARLFRVRVPKDWGQNVLTWTITANGRTEKAYGDLLPVQEINEHIIMSGGNSVPFGDEDPNKPPSITVAAVPQATIASPATLVATVVDDGLPKPRPPSKSAATSRGGTIVRQTDRVAAPRPRGLTVSWLQYGGPAKAVFEPAGAIPVTNGTASVKSRFTAPGTYTLVGIASDGQLSQRAVVVVTVPAR